MDDIQDRLHEAFTELNGETCVFLRSSRLTITLVSSPIDLPSPSLETAQKRSEYISQLLQDDLTLGEVDETLLSHLDSSPNLTIPPSMSRRRQACNRPTLKLHVEIPRATISHAAPGLLSSGATPLTASFHPFKLISAMENGISPRTPVDKCALVPDGPPEISRMIDMRNAMVGRWMPTPTEGVLPSAYAKVSFSPEEPLSTISSDSEGSDSTRSTVTLGSGNAKARPSIGKREVSWLSVHRSGQGSVPNSSALSSPFATPYPPTSPL